jgi:hypothetical protein
LRQLRGTVVVPVVPVPPPAAALERIAEKSPGKALAIALDSRTAPVIDVTVLVNMCRRDMYDISDMYALPGPSEC